ncbi:gp436 family protein [Aureimonas sp. SK2]|uniref:gp436 family protein n=1 Tax=Aureimonas sp. SK2 TaxID=3015992 RepID=UPI002444E8D8|nr:phage protein Gp36 family protein [Aureimonas sp. SK2]
MIQFATLADLEARHPAELITLAAHEQTGLRDDARVERAIEDATAEVRAILKARYSAAELERVDPESFATLRLYAMDVALYRISLAFTRTSEAITERYKSAIRRLEAIAAGKGALSFTGGDAGSGAATPSEASPGEVLIDAPARVFNRDRMRGL